jgi:hypothetical protein
LVAVHCHLPDCELLRVSGCDREEKKESPPSDPRRRFENAAASAVDHPGKRSNTATFDNTKRLRAVLPPGCCAAQSIHNGAAKTFVRQLFGDDQV